VEGYFPEACDGRFGNIIMSAVLRWASWRPVVDAAWERLDVHGRLVIVTYGDVESAYTRVLRDVGIDRFTAGTRLTEIRQHLARMGPTTLDAVRSHIRGSRDVLAQHVSFLATNHVRGTTEARERLFTRLRGLSAFDEYREPDGNYAFPVDHYLFHTTRMQ
jgi:hypothetical protein